MKDRVCLICGEPFTPQDARSRRCSRCKAQPCVRCGAPIAVALARMRTNPRRVCIRCYRKDRKPIRRVSGGYLAYTGYGRAGKDTLVHRQVMEIALGRALLPGEVIHHLNGIRSDNRIENLRLCSSNREHLDTYHKDGLVNPPKHHFGRDGVRARAYFRAARQRR
jgi:hypothetical protein